MFLKKKRNYLRWRYGHKRNFLGQLYRYKKPACRLLKTSQESRECLISLRQRCRLLKKRVRLIRAEKKRRHLCFQTELAEENHNHFTHRSYRGEHNESTSRKKKILTPNATKKVLYAGPKYFDKLSPSPARSEKPGLTTPHHVKSFILLVLLYLHNDAKIYLRLNQNAQR